MPGIPLLHKSGGGAILREMRIFRFMVALAGFAMPAIAEERPSSPGEDQPALELRQIDHDVAEAELAHKHGRMASPTSGCLS